MPELPEVEQFRRFLLPLVAPDCNGSPAVPNSKGGDQLVDDFLRVTLVNKNKLPRNWLSEEDVQGLNDKKLICTSVLRKGKQLCLVLTSTEGSICDAKVDANVKDNDNGSSVYLFLHMGMTGSIKSPGKTIYWGNNHNSPMAQKENGADGKEGEELFPPDYTYLTLQYRGYRVAFCDPRKFGKCEVSNTMSQMQQLAPDALNDTVKSEKDGEEDHSTNTKGMGKDSPGRHSASQAIIERICNQSIGIKALLLDQKRAVSGVGNWVADEVFYQLAIHPDQTHLTESESLQLVVKLHEILDCAVKCLVEERSYPETWLFLYRWTKGKKSNGGVPKDCRGRSLTFLKSGGRTSAIVSSLQKLQKRNPKKTATPKPSKRSKKQSKPSNDKACEEVVKKRASGGKGARKRSNQKSSPEEKVNSKRTRKEAAESSQAKPAEVNGKDATKSSGSPPRRRSPRFVSP
mmetsp:Transcript_13424/g.37049  ORF Transcript_13424/g.37049 Transcript_13424/m.37049 type:complete len:459 (-) Transcript_13424:1811-3187(-)